MARSTTTTKSKNATTAQKKETVKESIKEVAEVSEASKIKEEPAKVVPKEIDPNQLIVVKSGFQGVLVYISARTGEQFYWDEFGAEQEIELRELRNMKSSQKDFFIKNWILFNEEDSWVIDYLGLSQYYKNVLNIDEFDEIFTKTPEEVKDIISKLSAGQKKTVEYKARLLLRDGEIDSRKVISALEESLGVHLVER